MNVATFNALAEILCRASPYGARSGVSSGQTVADMLFEASICTVASENWHPPYQMPSPTSAMARAVRIVNPLWIAALDFLGVGVCQQGYGHRRAHRQGIGWGSRGIAARDDAIGKTGG